MENNFLGSDARRMSQKQIAAAKVKAKTSKTPKTPNSKTSSKKKTVVLGSDARLLPPAELSKLLAERDK